MAEKTVLDPTSLAALNAISPGDDGAFLKELMGIFLADTPSRLVDLENSTAANDLSGIIRAAHSIKGAASNFGAHELCDLARRIEAAGKTNDLTAVRPLVPRLVDAFADVRQQMESIRAR